MFPAGVRAEPTTVSGGAGCVGDVPGDSPGSRRDPALCRCCVSAVSRVRSSRLSAHPGGSSLV